MAGIALSFEREGQSRTRIIRLTATPPSEEEEKADAASVASALEDRGDATGADHMDATRTQAADANEDADEWSMTL